MPSRLRVAIVVFSCSMFVMVVTLGSRPLICSSLAGLLGLENEGHWNCSAPRAGNAMSVERARPSFNAVLIMTRLLRLAVFMPARLLFWNRARATQSETASQGAGDRGGHEIPSWHVSGCRI